MLTNVSLPDQGVLALVGYAVVFAGLVLLMIVVVLLGKFFTKKKAAKAEPVAIQEAEEAPVALAPGSAGELKLYDTNPKTAAMLMAIVADKLGKPLNELRFISIKEVK